MSLRSLDDDDVLLLEPDPQGRGLPAVLLGPPHGIEPGPPRIPDPGAPPGTLGLIPVVAEVRVRVMLWRGAPRLGFTARGDTRDEGEGNEAQLISTHVVSTRDPRGRSDRGSHGA